MTNAKDKAIQIRVDQFLSTVCGRMQYLRQRWADECKYEDFADYIDEARKVANKAGDGFEFVEWSRCGHLEVVVEKLFVHLVFLDSGNVLECITPSDLSDEQWKKVHSEMLVDLYKNKGLNSSGYMTTRRDDDDEYDRCMPETDECPRYRENMAETSGDELTKLDYMEKYDMEDDR